MLSFFSIFGIQNNSSWIFNYWWKVVNCFHFSVSLGYKTTDIVANTTGYLLWIAFIFQYLWDTKQLQNIVSLLSVGCELLSFFSIFGIQNNIHYKQTLSQPVVNCFHFSVSLGYKTTNDETFNATIGLWIAFIFQYLWDTKQPKEEQNKIITGCELLSFFSIFGIQNNITNPSPR